MFFVEKIVENEVLAVQLEELTHEVILLSYILETISNLTISGLKRSFLHRPLLFSCLLHFAQLPNHSLVLGELKLQLFFLPQFHVLILKSRSNRFRDESIVSFLQVASFPCASGDQQLHDLSRCDVLSKSVFFQPAVLWV